MKVAFFSEAYEPFINGVVTNIRTLRAALRARGHEVIIFAPAYPGHDDQDETIVRLRSVKWSRGHYPVLSPLAWRADPVAGQRFDLIHSHHPFSMSRPAVRLARKHDLPLVYSFHTMLTEYTHYAPVLQRAVKRWLTWTFRRHCAEADRVTTPTAVVRDFLCEQGVRTPIRVVPEGVPPLRAAPDARARVRGELALGNGVPTLLYVGRLVKEKQLDFLLRSLGRLRASRDFQLCLVGGGPRERALQRLAAELGLGEHVRFCGWVAPERVADYYAAADIFVFPSTSDTMGIVLAEAMGAGLPCIAVDRYGPGEIVVSEQTGFAVPFEERAFADAVRRLLDEPHLRGRMGEAAQRRARDFDPDVVAGRLCAVYEEVA